MARERNLPASPLVTPNFVASRPRPIEPVARTSQPTRHVPVPETGEPSHVAVNAPGASSREPRSPHARRLDRSLWRYVQGCDEQTYGGEIEPVTIDLLDIGRVPEWAKSSEPSIDHAVEVALQKDPHPFDRYVSAGWPGPPAGPAEQWGGAQAAAERALVPEKWNDPSQMTVEERRVAVFDPATGKAAWFELIFADTEGPSDEDAIRAGSAQAQWHAFEYEAESVTPWDDQDEEERTVTCQD